jgi:hypothetical protein
MTAAAQKEIVEKALALPRKARGQLARQLLESLNSGKTKEIPGPKVLREQQVKYVAVDEGETLSREEWNEAWEAELKKRIAEVESGKVKCIPYAEARKRWNKILGRT